VNQATRAVVAANNGNVKATHGFAAQLPLAGLYGLFGSWPASGLRSASSCRSDPA